MIVQQPAPSTCLPPPFLGPPLPASPALQACAWAIDELKATVPIWKKEFFEGGEVWKENEEWRAAQAALRQARLAGGGGGGGGLAAAEQQQQQLQDASVGDESR